VCAYSARRAFTLLNCLFSEFDDQVIELRMFKYHHIYNTYLVCSPSAALEVFFHFFLYIVQHNTCVCIFHGVMRDTMYTPRVGFRVEG
jgi:hypothetical protein